MAADFAGSLGCTALDALHGNRVEGEHRTSCRTASPYRAPCPVSPRRGVPPVPRRAVTAADMRIGPRRRTLRA
jgi:hypothetical protein